MGVDFQLPYLGKCSALHDCFGFALRCRSLEKEDDNLDYGTYDYDEGDIAEVNLKAFRLQYEGSPDRKVGIFLSLR